MTPLATRTFHEARAFVAGWRRAALFSHEKPDGDAIGSLVAMRAVLCEAGVQAEAILFDPLPDRYSLFRRRAPLPVLGRDLSLDDLATHDGVIVLDTCAFSQLRPVADWLRSTSKPKLVVDHHATRDDLGDLRLIDETAAATCLILYDWIRTVGWALHEEAAEALFVGIATDTGWFRHSNTDDRALAVCADLVVRGVQPNELHQAMFQNESPARLRLLGAAIESLELRMKNRLAVLSLTPEAFARCAATPADTEDLVNEPLRIGSALVSLLFVESGDGVVRVSLRSKSPSADQPDIDVATIAEQFGGGGHRRAAGAKISGALGSIRDAVIARVELALGSAN